jgi:hypothetical protein
VFNVHIGKAIALRRALRLNVPQAYLSVPQPTEAQVGDVVLATWISHEKVATVYAIQPEKRTYGIGAGHVFSEPSRGFTFIDPSDDYETWTFLSNVHKIIDDSRDGYVYDVDRYRKARAKDERSGVKAGVAA